MVAARGRLPDDGFAILRGAVDPGIIADIEADLADRFVATPFCEGGFYGERTKRFGRLLIRSPRVEALVRHPEILALAEGVLGPWCDRIQLNLAQAIELHPGALPQFPHRDEDMWQAEHGRIEYLVNIIWPLTPFIGEYAAFYREQYGREESVADLIPAMLAAFLDNDRAFQRLRRERSGKGG